MLQFKLFHGSCIYNSIPTKAASQTTNHWSAKNYLNVPIVTLNVLCGLLNCRKPSIPLHSRTLQITGLWLFVFNFWYFIESGRKKKSEGKRNMELPEVQSKKKGKKSLYGYPLTKTLLLNSPIVSVSTANRMIFYIFSPEGKRYFFQAHSLFIYLYYSTP